MFPFNESAHYLNAAKHMPRETDSLPSSGSTPDVPPLIDPRAQGPNKSIGHLRLVPRGAERVAPLAIGQLGEQIARPRDVFGRNAIAHQLLVPAFVTKV